MNIEYVWHCLPFSEGAQYGIELLCLKNLMLWWKKWAKKSAPSESCRLGASMPAEPLCRQKRTGLRLQTPCSMGLIEISFEPQKRRSKKIE
jgi:hypothetical protein